MGWFKGMIAVAEEDGGPRRQPPAKKKGSLL